MRHWKKLAALVLGAALFLTGCGQPKEPAAVTIDGVEFTQADYEGVLVYTKNMMDMQLVQYGMDPVVFWGSQEEYEQQITLTARQQLTMEAVLRSQMKENKLKLDEEKLERKLADQEKQLEDPEELDEMLAQMKLTREQYTRMLSVDVMYEQLKQQLTIEEEETVRADFEKTYMRCKHVLIHDEEGKPELEKLAGEVADKAHGGADFDDLIEQYGADPGTVAYPDGYVFTDGEMEENFEKATKALEIGGISDPVRSAYGWHIIQRLPLDDESYEKNRTAILDRWFSVQLRQWMDAAQLTLSPEAEAVTMESILPPVEEPAEGEAPAQGEAPAGGEAPAASPAEEEKAE